MAPFIRTPLVPASGAGDGDDVDGRDIKRKVGFMVIELKMTVVVTLEVSIVALKALNMEAENELEVKELVI
jgi:hypothetical protein